MASDCARMAGAARPSNGQRPWLPPLADATLLARLRDGEARFELLEDSGGAASATPPVWPGLSCFARVATSLRGGWSGALNKVEHYGVQRVTGDGRCMFRALVKGMAKNKGISLTPREEVQDADDLRMAVKEVICDDAIERQKYEEAVIAITVEESLRRYCHRIRRSDFWGGESELLSVSIVDVEMVLFL
ncbi:OVARIAN TUMOR DOMAIN-containing deubiquitinating enzyme 3 isoform X3 [Oryza brachyantha]|uniref:OVARIAN TUMOR DOMAIN-containing deubiquitinating enzyme 3 isoform X3 n=1 Tax=Oryza brachyantha TaxID=4533 RepID=UPI00077673C0|nr:OVARIAN TUMOR DOMAIN-containing deubiquitinating enzyme 3 isoform X3 [Oryza brachyantha]